MNEKSEKEIKMFADQYLTVKKDRPVYGKIEQIYIDKLIPNMKSCECPDIVSCFDDKVVGIELFEFDTYKNDKKGSEMRIYESYLNKSGDQIDYQKIINMIYSKSLTRYFSNFEKVFLNHYSKIKNYKDNLSEKYPGKEIVICFLVRDVTFYGNMCVENKKNRPLLPIFSKEMLDLVKECSEIDYIFFCVDKICDKTNIYCEELMVLFKNDESGYRCVEEIIEDRNITAESYNKYFPFRVIVE